MSERDVERKQSDQIHLTGAYLPPRRPWAFWVRGMYTYLGGQVHLYMLGSIASTNLLVREFHCIGTCNYDFV